MKRIKALDFYGYPVSLQYNKRQNYQTHIGGISTILTGVMLLGYFGFMLFDIITH